MIDRYANTPTEASSPDPEQEPGDSAIESPCSTETTEPAEAAKSGESNETTDAEALIPRRRRKYLPERTFVIFPTLCTLANVMCGFAAIFYASKEIGLVYDASGMVIIKGWMPLGWTPLTVAAAFVFTGMIFDGLDGRIARLTHSTSELGEQLDSMADMVTFGVAPAFIATQLVIGSQMPFLTQEGDAVFNRAALVIAGLYVACAALRLARFNVETLSGEDTDHMSFAGMPSPGAAGTIVSLTLLHQHFLAHEMGDHWSVIASSVVIVGIMLLCALAMVTRMRYAHVLNRYLRGRAPLSYLVLAVLVGGLLIIRLQLSVATAFVIYALSGPVAAGWSWLHRKSRQPQQSSN